MNLLDRLKGGTRDISTVDDYIELYNQFNFGGIAYGYGSGGYGISGTPVQQTLAGQTTEMAPNNFIGLSTHAYGSNGVVFACMMVRQLLFSAIRFQWQRIRDGKPSDTFSSSDLALLERPWLGATTQDLLSKMIQHVDLCGNSYVTREDDELLVMRPDWVDIVVEPRMKKDGRGQIGWRKVGYIYTDGGTASGADPVGLLADEVTHFAPIPDPQASFRGMSWLTPIIREIQADQAMTLHQRKFFDNGAPQPLDAKVLTPSGWSTMGAMVVGAQVIGSDGKAHDVTAVHPQGTQDIYRVTFSSGTSTECTRDHLWRVASAYDRRLGVTRTMTLAEIIDDGITYKSGPAKWSVPLVAPIEFDDSGPLPIAPYLLGSLLGDGCLRSNVTGVSGTPKLACHTTDVTEQQRLLEPLLPDGVQMTRTADDGNCATVSFARVKGGPRRNSLTEAIGQLGLFDCIGHKKFVPECYMRASVTDRIALLRGLLDTDGSVYARQPNEVRFTSTSERLARQVAELGSSLGGIGTVRASRVASNSHRAQWTARIARFPEWIVPFALVRKATIYRPTLRGGAYRYIQKVELVGCKPAQCISVDSDDHLYVTDDYILTHNTVNMIIKHAPGADRDAVQRWAEQMQDKFGGARNAYKTLNLYPGADPVVVGSNLKDIDFKNVRGGGETRIAAAAGVPPVIVGLSEGLAAATYSNYGQARRRLADGTAHPLWQNLAGSMERVITKPGRFNDDIRLWYDATDVPFLREDEADAANILKTKAETAFSLISSGFEPESIIKSIESGDLGLLKHTGMTSVQLQTPGAETEKPVEKPAEKPVENGQVKELSKAE